MKSLFIGIFCATLVLLHISAAGSFFQPERIPNITLTLVISLVFIFGFERSIFWIILAGFLLDVVSGHIFGTSALLFVIIGWTISALSTAVDFKSRRLLFLPALFLLVAGLVFAFDVLEGLFVRISGAWLDFEGNISGINYFNWDYVLKMVLTALSVYIIYYLAMRLNKFLLIWR